MTLQDTDPEANNDRDGSLHNTGNSGLTPVLICVSCFTSFQSIASICPACGFDMAQLGKTTKFSTSGLLPGQRKRPVGRLTAHKQIQLVFEMEGRELALPIGEALTVGRVNPGDTPPDIDLNKFDAANHGVSRQHIRISRNRNIFHLCDLQSANGTFLNGYKLTPHQEHLLHDGDELRLSRLTIKIRFKK